MNARRILWTGLLIAAPCAHANNIQVSNIGLVGQDIGQGTVLVQFDVGWENSWRISAGPANWDAAWVFVKYRRNGGAWEHATLNYVDGTAGSDGHAEPPGATIATPPGGAGVLIHRDSEGSGNVLFNAARVHWNYGADGVLDTDLVDVQVFAIEMVYVPGGTFSVGDGGLSQGRFYPYPFTGLPYTIDSEAAIPVGTQTGYLYYANLSGNQGDQAGPIPAAFPKGYRAFYCMKYEASQGQWTAFFNTLTSAQKTNRDITDANRKNNDTEVGRNTIAWTSGDATTSTPDRPVNYANNADYLAYLDWAGLRPMTELEFEKACRGPLPPVANEFAWGSANIYAGGAYTLAADGTASESISNPAANTGNAGYTTTASSFNGPLRCGIFAASAINKTREETGGSYYGIMELSGNLYERAVSVGRSDGRSFDGRHGDGELDLNGNANVTNWPSTTGGGIGYRGAAFANSTVFLRVSDRYDAAQTSDIVNNRIGFRGVLTAP